jgi:hypothetical protein
VDPPNESPVSGPRFRPCSQSRSMSASRFSIVSSPESAAEPRSLEDEDAACACGALGVEDGPTVREDASAGGAGWDNHGDAVRGDTVDGAFDDADSKAAGGRVGVAVRLVGVEAALAVFVAPGLTVLMLFRAAADPANAKPATGG